MATFKAVVDHRKADGTYCVKIRITHNRKSLYLPTSLFVTDRHLTRSKTIKDHAYLMAANRLIDEMRTIILDIDRIELLDCNRLRKIIHDRMTRGKEFRLNFFDFATEQIEKLHLCNSRLHVTAVNYMRELCGERLDINDITYNLIVRYRDFILSKGLAINSVVQYLTKIKHIVNLAKDEYNDDEEIRVKVNPFRKGVIPDKEATEHRTLTAEQMRRIVTIKGNRYENFARDVFMLSFCLIGINMIDLFNLKKDNFKDAILTYCRQKTKNARKDKAMIGVKVEDEAMLYFHRYRDMGSEYLLNFHNRYVNHENMTSSVNTKLKRLRNYDPTLPAGLTYYYARHTWATIAYNECGIDMQTIHEALNHASDARMKITDVYVKKDYSRIWDANRKVLDHVFGGSFPLSE